MQIEDTQNVKGVAESPVIQMLLDQRHRLMADVNRIDRMLAREGLDVQSLSRGEGEALTQSGRARNTINKLDALMHVLETATKPLSQKELVIGIQNMGFVFASRNPSNTLNPLLYGEKKLTTVKKIPGGFILATREKEFEGPSV